MWGDVRRTEGTGSRWENPFSKGFSSINNVNTSVRTVLSGGLSERLWISAEGNGDFVNIGEFGSGDIISVELFAVEGDFLHAELNVS